MENYIVENFNQFLLIILAITVWAGVWKAVALWKAARLGSKPWYIALFILNTVGILEILYIFVFSKMGKKTK